MIVHRGVPLVDLTGRGWASLEDYAWADQGEDVALYEIRLSLEPIVERLWPGNSVEVRKRLALVTKESAERGAHVITYTSPDSDEYRKLREEARRSMQELVLSIDGHRIPLSDSIVVHSMHAYLLVAVPRRGVALRLERGGVEFSMSLPRGEPHVVIRREGRVIRDFVGVVVADVADPSRTVYRALSVTDQTLFCLHPPPRE